MAVPRSAPISAFAITAAITFYLTALLGFWLAYDRTAARSRFYLISLGVLVALLIVAAGLRWRWPALIVVATGCGLLAGAVGAYFLLAYDWAAEPGPVKFAFIQQAGLWVQAHRPGLHMPEDINGNVAGGALAVLLPLGFGALAWALARPARTWPLAVLLAGALSVASLALFLTASRGSWLGLFAGIVVAACLSVAPVQRSIRSRRGYLVLFIGFVLACLAFFWAALSVPAVGRLTGNAGGQAGAAAIDGAHAAAGLGRAAIGRADLWRDMLALILDYPFTGSGFGSTMMVFSSYVFLLHVGYIPHAHNLFLQLAIEQGLPGLFAFLALLGMAGWRLASRSTGSQAEQLDAPPAMPLLRACIAASLVVLIASGMLDAGIYVSKAVPALSCRLVWRSPGLLCGRPASAFRSLAGPSP